MTTRVTMNAALLAAALSGAALRVSAQEGVAQDTATETGFVPLPEALPEAAPETTTETAPAQPQETAPEPAPKPAITGTVTTDGSLTVYNTARETEEKIPFEHWFGAALEANIAAIARSDGTLKSSPHNPNDLDFDLELKLKAWNAVMVGGTYVPDDQHLMAFKAGLATTQPLGKDIDITLELPFVANSDGANFSAGVRTDFHIPNDYLPDLRVGAAAEVVMPFERLFGGGLEGSRVHLEAELATHLFKVTDSIALEPEFAFKITDFTHASEAERDTGLAFAATLGLQAHFGRDAEVTLRHGTQTAYTSSASVAASPETEGTLELKGEPTARTASKEF